MKNKQVRTRQFRGMFSVIDLGKDNQFCRNLICSKRIKVIETNLSWNIQLWKTGKEVRTRDLGTWCETWWAFQRNMCAKKKWVVDGNLGTPTQLVWNGRGILVLLSVLLAIIFCFVFCVVSLNRVCIPSW